MFVPRVLDPVALTARRSCFLLGPRQTGKSTLLRASLPPQTPFYNLLDHRTWLSLSADPGRMRDELAAKDLRDGLVVVDEIQKLPRLLDAVHLLIEERGLRFLLTGSSARKLRRAGVNLLGGRARVRYMHPFSWFELGARFELDRALANGLIPSIYFSDEPEADLGAYTGLYLKEEIAAEGLTRNVPAFARFLEVAAACSGQMINKTAIANDAKVPRTTVIEYFEILKDTLIGHELESWTRTQKRKAIETAKFYLFDVGVTRALRGVPAPSPKTAEFGAAFEHFVFHELRTYVDARRSGLGLSYWRSKSGFEVDFILGDRTAIEVKAAASVSQRDLRGLRALAEEKMLERYILVCREPTARMLGSVLVLPWEEFLGRLWADELAD